MPTVKGAHKVNSRYFPNRAILARSPNFLLNLNWQAVVQRSGWQGSKSASTVPLSLADQLSDWSL